MANPTLEISEALKSAAIYSLETLAFTEINPKPESILEKPEKEYLGARISMGTMGNLNLVLSRQLLFDIVEVLLNPPNGDVSEETMNDTLNEILNIIAGRFLESIFKNQSDFALGLPEIHLSVAEWNQLPMRCILAADAGYELAVGIGPETNE